ncbi:MAG: CTP synthetase, partial [Pseudomonadota bacterium]
GMQMAVIEAARNQANVKDAGSEEWNTDRAERGEKPVKNPIIYFMPEWLEGNETVERDREGDKGGSMRLGAFPATLSEGSQVADAYQDLAISERHRHRFEVDISYREQLEQCGLMFSGLSPDGRLPEIVERPDHPFFVGVQFHPELKSKPFEPHPLFVGFVKAAVAQSRLV